MKTNSQTTKPLPSSPQQLAQAIFAQADKRLPADKRRFTKRLLKNRKK